MKMKEIKHRKAYHEIEKAMKIRAFVVIVLVGLRKTGKTEILKQLAQNYDGHYHNFRDKELTYEQAEDLLDREESLLLFDEICYLDSFDLFMGNAFQLAADKGKKIVITSSSYGALKQLSGEKLGGGRSHTVELFPLSFEEYLHFSGRLLAYGEDYEPTEQDVEDFYRLKDVPEGMEFIINREYMLDAFRDNAVASANYYHTERDMALTPEQYISVLDIIAYTLNDQISMKRFTGSQIGRQEFTNTKGLPLSQSLIGLANKIVNDMARDIHKNIGIEDLIHIVRYLYHTGFLFVDLKSNEDMSQKLDKALDGLAYSNSYESFVNFFKEFNFSVISPLLYTRLLIDLESIASELYTNEGLKGSLYELAVKSEDLRRNGYDIWHRSTKYKSPRAEIDLWHWNLLLEATTTHKKDGEHSVDKVLKNHQLTRVLADKEGAWEDTGTFYRIGYPKALLMISNNTIRNLEARKIEE